jgi:hypothetical protein
MVGEKYSVLIFSFPISGKMLISSALFARIFTLLFSY